MDSTQRFTNRVSNYVRYRPSYPSKMVSVLEAEHGFHSNMRLADVGAGTGKLTEVFLKAGYNVLAIEPNQAMREAAEKLFAEQTGFTSLGAAAEALPLENGSLDAIMVGQALHWFDYSLARQEFLRVLKPLAPLAVVFNNRRTQSSRFLQDYEALLYKHCKDYPRIGNKHYKEEKLQEFFGGTIPTKHILENAQTFDWTSLVGRLLSSSYAPSSGKAHELLLADMEKLFQQYQQNGLVQFLYDCEVFCAPFSRPSDR